MNSAPSVNRMRMGPLSYGRLMMMMIVPTESGGGNVGPPHPAASQTGLLRIGRLISVVVNVPDTIAAPLGTVELMASVRASVTPPEGWPPGPPPPIAAARSPSDPPPALCAASLDC